MLDYGMIFRGETSLSQLAEGLTRDDLARMTNEMVDRQLELIAEATDELVTFVPEDPSATETPWTLGHVIVHTTASAEETAFLSAEMARGVEHHGRSRYETYWEEMQTIAQCRARLEESRRMRLATLQVWPDEPHMQITRFLPFLNNDSVNPIAHFMLGLSHDWSHLGQIEEIVRQGRQLKS